jgi:hypothetical protein
MRPSRHRPAGRDPLPRGETRRGPAGAFRLLLALALPAFGNEASPPRLDGSTPAERGAALVAYVATCKPSAKDETYPKAAAPAYAARLLLGIDTAYALGKLDAAVASRIARAKSGPPGNPLSPPGLDPFDKVALVNTYFLCKERIPAATAGKIRDYCGLYAHETWRGYGAMNYRLMMDGAGYLAAEEWPELTDAGGLDAAAIRKATGERLNGYFEQITRGNFDEYGCPIYLAVDLSAIRMLAEFARSPAMRTRATLTLDAMMLDIACSWNQGLHAGTAARAKYWGSTDTGFEAMGSTAAAAWVWFGAPRSIAASGTGWIHSFWMATRGRYQVPELVTRIANDRATPFTHRGSVPSMGVFRSTYHSANYSLGSQWDTPQNPANALYKESRRHLLKWVSDKPSSTFCVCMENPRRPYNLKENVANALGYGENPFSQYLQHEGTLIGVYDVPPDYPYYKLYVPFPTSGSIVRRVERDGWIFCHNGSMLMAFRSIRPAAWGKPWSGNDMLWCESRRNGWILETSELAPFSGGGPDAELERFAAALLDRTRVDASGLDQPAPRLRFTSLGGHRLDLTWLPHRQPYAGQAKIDGQAVDYPSWPLHGNPWVRQRPGNPALELKHGRDRLSYDFARWTRREWRDDGP